MMWNRIRSAAEWVPSDTVSEADVISGKTFHNTSRTQKTGTGLPAGSVCTTSAECIGGHTCTTTITK